MKYVLITPDKISIPHVTFYKYTDTESYKSS